MIDVNERPATEPKPPPPPLPTALLGLRYHVFRLPGHQAERADPVIDVNERPAIRPASVNPPTWDIVATRAMDRRDQVAESGGDVAANDAMIKRFFRRDLKGREHYGVPLHAGLDLDMLGEGADEAADLCAYLEAAHAKAPTLRLRMLADEAAAFALKVERYIQDTKQAGS